MTRKHLIFDFDGTVVESGPLIYSHLSQYSKNDNLSWNDLRNLPSNEVVSALGISKVDLPKLILKIRDDFKLKIADQPIVSGIKEAITELKEKGFDIHFVSSNSKENIDEFLQLHNLREAISTVTSFFTIFGKAHGISKTLKEFDISTDSAVYIADETRDVQAAEKVGIQSIAVTWGYNSEKPLREYKPNFLVSSPEELVSILCKDLG